MKHRAEELFDATAAFTGPRPHRFPFGENEAAQECLALKAVLQREIEALCDAGITRFLTGAAAGVDMWCGEIVLELIAQGRAIELIAIVPFRNQEEKFSKKNKVRYAAILAKCSEVLVLSEHYYEGSYKVRNHYMIEHAKYLLAVQDHSRRPNSGTRQTISLAMKNGNTIIYASANEKPAQT